MSATETSDSGMFKMMGIVCAALTLFTLICMGMARLLGIGEPEYDPLMRNALIERIQPVGKVRTEATAVADAATLTVASTDAQPAAQLTDAELVTGACAACHIAGVANAPKIGDDAEWAKRRATGLEMLVASVVNGKGAMPPGGGSNYSAEDIERAVKNMAGF